MVGISHFDNSPNNKFNPDPGKEIRWGLQNWDEMSNAFIGLVYDSKVDPKKAEFRSGPSLLPTGTAGADAGCYGRCRREINSARARSHLHAVRIYEQCCRRDHLSSMLVPGLARCSLGG